MVPATIHSNYRNINQLREAFFDFIPKVYEGLSFREWYELGFWGDCYIPFSVFYKNEIISNVSVYEVEVIINGKIKKAVQLATIGTLPEYRKHGLASQLITKILKKYQSSTSLFFLFSNSYTVEFYTKLNFILTREWLFSSFTTSSKKQALHARKLDMQKLEDQELLKNMLRTRLPITTRFGATDYSHIFLWHSIYFWRDFLWYIPEKNIVILGYEYKGILHIYDILYKNHFSAKETLPYIKGFNFHKILFYFTPENIDIPNKPEKIYTDSPLFIKGDFSVDNIHFKFPITGQA
ncbi:MAG: GNAT family N-acetyltransferase [Candidatus Electrothrix sp. AS4_5]|nr:GNAT family N-acetyltransferase [Candidatus Electrothrix gigas]